MNQITGQRFPVIGVQKENHKMKTINQEVRGEAKTNVQGNLRLDQDWITLNHK